MTTAELRELADVIDRRDKLERARWGYGRRGDEKGLKVAARMLKPLQDRETELRAKLQKEGLPR